MSSVQNWYYDNITDSCVATTNGKGYGVRVVAYCCQFTDTTLKGGKPQNKAQMRSLLMTDPTHSPTQRPTEHENEK